MPENVVNSLASYITNGLLDQCDTNLNVWIDLQCRLYKQMTYCDGFVINQTVVVIESIWLIQFSSHLNTVKVAALLCCVVIRPSENVWCRSSFF
tara:strand:+ start:621 stop:902 length:282 start_codon:yes stop_codon:yes gene_type:complete